VKTAKLKDMTRGWFVGNFEQSIFKTNDVEVAIKQYQAGDYEQRHYHKVAAEITVIVSGEAEMNGKKYEAGDIIVIEPGEDTDFRAMTKTVNVVVKIPGVNKDKYFNGG
jgi:quercetin dioxygenase-like cupin family protein